MGTIFNMVFTAIKNKKFSRLDLAFDMIDVDVKGYLPYVFGASKVFFMIVLWNFGSIYKLEPHGVKI